MNRNIVKQVIDNGGSIVPLVIPSSETNGTGLMNPSIYLDNNQLILNLRHVNYTIYHCEGEQLYSNRWGPLAYLNPENDIHLKTNNFICTLDADLSIKNFNKVDTSKLDVPNPKWEFHGLEDARLVRWDGSLYMCGVRRDTTDNGQGRMELSQIYVSGNKVTEINRYRIEHPTDPNTYCEKNWMPITDMPYHFVKWTNPTEIVKVNPKTNTSNVVLLKNQIGNVNNLRGSSHVIPYKNKRICVTHECDFFYNKLGQKDAIYTHRFIVWDKDWNIEHISEPFNFLDTRIEFCCGMIEYKDDLLISFGYQDNAAFLLRMSRHFFESFLPMVDFESNSLLKSSIIESKPESLKLAKEPILEITTSMPQNGCVVNCIFCPQRTISNIYKGERMLSLENFISVVDKIPKELGIIFAGFSEPYLNRSCTDMILYAHDTGHKVSLYTTGIGMTKEDIDRIKHIPFAAGPNRGFTLHLPDNENYAKHPITQKYIEVLEYLKQSTLNMPNFYVISMGTVHDRVKHIFPKVYPHAQMYSRAGNLQKESLLKPELIDLKNKYITTYNGEGNISCGVPEKLHHCTMLPNGDVTICCQDYELKHIIGNLYQQKYEDIAPKSNTPFDLCRYCENGIYVKN